MYILCIDPGIVSVGLFGADMNTLGHISGIRVCANVDMTKPFATPKNIYTYIDTFLHTYKIHFIAADVLVVEKQPITSAGMPIELLIRERYGKKCTFVHPATLHKHYGTAGYEYNARKRMAVDLITDALRQWEHQKVEGAGDALASILSMERQHDCCDAALFFMYYATVLHKVPVIIDSEEVSFSDFVAQFKYVPQCPRIPKS